MLSEIEGRWVTRRQGWVGRGTGTPVVYYESIKREPKRRLLHDYRCDERLKTKNEESALLTDTGLVVV
jgi:hypothetical protein